MAVSSPPPSPADCPNVAMHWNWWHFASIDYNCDDPNFHAIWRMKDSGLPIMWIRKKEITTI
jgi:hypothetical protein